MIAKLSLNPTSSTLTEFSTRPTRRSALGSYLHQLGYHRKAYSSTWQIIRDLCLDIMVCWHKLLLRVAETMTRAGT